MKHIEKIQILQLKSGKIQAFLVNNEQTLHLMPKKQVKIESFWTQTLHPIL